MHETTSQTFLFADLVGFTALTEEQGDEIAADTALGFARAVEAIAEEHGATLVKLVGDCVMLRIERADDAIRLGLRLVRDLPGRHGLPAVRAGAHTGTAVERAGDWFGATVNLAARITGAARGGELLVTGSTAAAAATAPDLHLEDLGLQEFHNVARMVPVFACKPRRFTRATVEPLLRAA